jgi:maleate isomerase
VVSAASAALPSEQLAINPGQLFEWIRRNTPDTAEAVYVGGNGLRAVGIIQDLEEELQRPVLTANQVLFWNLLRLAGARVTVTNYGRLFALDLPA